MVRIAIGRFTDRANRQLRCRSKADPARLRRQSKLHRQTRQLASDRATHLRQLTISIPSHRVARQPRTERRHRLVDVIQLNRNRA
jgi:hypothetical protein